jgi:glycosyltransferase involved in cell wall biosynthesis
MKNTLPKISVITVVYNGAKTLEKTIQSVVEQDYTSLEYIVVDGGSTDGTRDIITNYETGYGNSQSRITKSVSEPDNGIYDAMNKGVSMSSGDYLCFLNSGDVFVDKQSVAKIVESLLANALPDVIYGNILVANKEGGFMERIAKEPCNLHRMYFCHQSAFTKKEWLQKFPFDTKHTLSADLKFFKQCWYAGCRFVHVRFPVTIYDLTGLSNTNRCKGLYDNISVIKETDRVPDKYKFLLRLYFVIYWRKLNGKN